MSNIVLLSAKLEHYFETHYKVPFLSTLWLDIWIQKEIGATTNFMKIFKIIVVQTLNKIANKESNYGVSHFACVMLNHCFIFNIVIQVMQ